MEEKSKDKVCSAVYRQFPEMKGERPSVKALPGEKWQLIFHGKGQTADGKTIQRTVRVAADGSGKILKLSTSR
jgi:hypothetical protein